MERANTITHANAVPLTVRLDLGKKDRDSRNPFYLRDISHRRFAGSFESEPIALASLRGGPDGHFSINNHHGQWCEVEVRGGDRYIRHALMANGSPVAFRNIDTSG